MFAQYTTGSFWLNDNEDSGSVGANELVEWQGTKVHRRRVWRNKQMVQSIVSRQLFEQLAPFSLI